MEAVTDKMADVKIEQAKQQQQQQGGAKKDKKKDKKAAAKAANMLQEPPEYINHRIEMFDRLMAKHKEELAQKAHEMINVRLPDGKVIEAKSWKDSPYDIAMGISKRLAEDKFIAKVDGVVWDMKRPLEKSCELQLLDFEDEDARAVFWHSSAHMLGEAMELKYGCHLCYGPPIKDGFYYDCNMPEVGMAVSAQTDFPVLEKEMKNISNQKQPFERLVMSKADLLEMFKHNEFKHRIINERIKESHTTVYRCGPLIDLCRGPHVPHTGKVKAMAVTKTSSAYWEGNAEAEVLQRVYGISFPDNKQLKEWKHIQEEAAKRDHRKLGKEQELFFFHEWSPGSCFFLPHGGRIYNALMNLIRDQYKLRGFEEVVTPNLFNVKLWETSGHAKFYIDDMFTLEVEKEQWGLKPMNCPGHCLMFKNRVRSYRELPWRVADFGVLHRNELSGALTGLTRVRRFQQDDAHIFCAFDQLEVEMKSCFGFLKDIYGKFGFLFELNLSTRPEKYLGELSVWERAEKSLENCLNEEFGPKGWKLNPGDGAFYGPKIDIKISDALKRLHQCATIQLDFQLPERFDLKYTAGEGKEERPIIIHRAVLGSVERMFGILLEHYGGKWPFFLSPRQVMVVPIATKYEEYSEKVRKQIHDAGYFVDTDFSADTLNKKIRNAQLAQYNFILVCGEQEELHETVNIRTRDNQRHGEKKISDLISYFDRLKVECPANDTLEG
eukprot:Nk52_evm48s222 gene=Nk52_evmTU48s222